MRDAARPIRAVVVDDEPSGREAILTLLAHEPAITVVGEAADGERAVDLIRRTQPDLLFLDIQMPDLNGFDVLAALGDDVPRGVVFVTAHDEHAIHAFDVHALDYVLKPFGRPRFHAAVRRALERLSALDALTLQQTLASMAQDRNGSTDVVGALEGAVSERRKSAAAARRIGVRNGTRVVLLELDAIDWVEASGDYARIHAGKQAHLISQRMHALERLLESADFVRIHRSVIVNLKRVRELHRESDGGGTIVLQDGVRLRVARGRWDALQSALAIEEFG